jgi:hypothetical protein
MPKTITFTTWERVKMSNALGVLSGLNLAGLRQANALLDKLELGEEEKKQVGWREIKRQGVISCVWENNPGWDIEVSDRETQLLQYALNEFSGWAVPELESVEILLNKLAINKK